MVQGTTRGVTVLARPTSSQVICSRVLMAKPSAGTTGLDDSQPPDGVAATMLPCRSITSMWQVSPTNTSRSAHSATGGRAANVGSPMPKRVSAVRSVRSAAPRSGRRGAMPSGAPARSSADAWALVSLQRARR